MMICIIAVAAICIGILAAWCFVPLWRSRIERTAPILSLVASIATLSVFLQFYQSWKLAAQGYERENAQSRAHFSARMAALANEIVANIQTCNLFEKEREQYLKGTVTPGIQFEFGVAQSMIQNGDITDHRLRAQLMSLSSQMRSLNAQIKLGMSLMVMKGTAGQGGVAGAQDQIRILTAGILGHVAEVRKQLSNLQPLVESFWRSPERFESNAYLMDKVVPEGLIP